MKVFLKFIAKFQISSNIKEILNTSKTRKEIKRVNSQVVSSVGTTGCGLTSLSGVAGWLLKQGGDWTTSAVVNDFRSNTWGRRGLLLSIDTFAASTRSTVSAPRSAFCSAVSGQLLDWDSISKSDGCINS